MQETESLEPLLHLTLTIATTSEPGGTPQSAWIGEFVIPRGQRDAVTAEVKGLADADQHLPHVLRHDGGETSWGAHGPEFYNISLFVAEHATDAAFGAAVTAIFGALKRRFGRHDDAFIDRPLSREEAVTRARFALAGSLRHADRRGRIVDIDELELLSDEHDLETERWTIAFRDPYGVRYEVELGFRENLPYTTRIRRES